MSENGSLGESIRLREEQAPHVPAKLFGVDDRDVSELEQVCVDLGVQGRSKTELFFCDDQDVQGHLETVFRLEC